MMKKRVLAIMFITVLSASAFAQVGEHRSRFALGGNAGYILSNVGFTPSVPQTMYGGMTFGLSARYTCEKYFSTVCAIGGEVNYAQIGWKEKILDGQDAPVTLPETDIPMEYKRNLTYVQIPLYAHLAWGREKKGFSFFAKAGPQFGICISDSHTANFDVYNPAEYNMSKRASQTVAQDTMRVENKFDYGIMAGAGLEYSHPKIGHFLVEGRYYFGLGNIYKDSKRDFFAKSAFGNIVIKLTYLFDLIKKDKGD